MKRNRKDLVVIAKEIIDANVYIVVGTADESGQPWVTPVYFSCTDHKEFYWISSLDVRHSQNIARRPQVTIVVFDSQVPVDAGQAVYMSGVAEELIGPDVERGLVIYNGRFSNPAEHGVHVIDSKDVQTPGLYRLYRTVVSKHSVLDPAGRPDHQTSVTL